MTATIVYFMALLYVGACIEGFLEWMHRVVITPEKVVTGVILLTAAAVLCSAVQHYRDEDLPLLASVRAVTLGEVIGTALVLLLFITMVWAGILGLDYLFRP